MEVQVVLRCMLSVLHEGLSSSEVALICLKNVGAFSLPSLALSTLLNFLGYRNAFTIRFSAEKPLTSAHECSSSSRNCRRM